MVEDFTPPNQEEVAYRTDEQVQHIPVAEVGAAAVESTENGQIDSSTLRKGEENYVQDSDKALVMAEASDDFRTKAVANRDAGELREKVFDTWGEHAKLRSSIAFETGGNPSEAQQEALASAERASEAAKQLADKAENKTNEQYKEDDLRPYYTQDQSPRNRARDYDEEAANLENSAGKAYDDYKELYHLNIDKFATMPTSEFMEIADQYKALSNAVKVSETYQIEFGQLSDEFTSALEEKRWPTSYSEGNGNSTEIFVSASATEVLGYDAADENKNPKAIAAEWHELSDPSKTFDKTARQVIQDQLDWILRYGEKVHTRQAENKQAVQNFLDSHKPQDSSSESN